jgi:transposase
MKPLVPDELWQKLEPLVPPPRRRRFRFPGRKPLDYRKILMGILFLLKTGIAWTTCPLNSAAVAAKPAGTTSGSGT